MSKPQKLLESPNAPTNRQFNMICHDMYKCFGAVAKAIELNCETDEAKQTLGLELARLRDAVRALLEEARSA